METRVYVLHALAPLHCGTGQGEGLIDLPIARERASEHPILPGSSVKGVLREAARVVHEGDKDSKAVAWLFGPGRDNAHEHAGTLRFSDARLILFPVTSDAGTFAWVTCPWVLARLVRDAPWLKKQDKTTLPSVERGKALLSSTSRLRGPAGPVLGGLRMSAGNLDAAWSTLLAELAFHDPVWQGLLQERLAVVPDDTFTWLVRNRTDVRAHIAINPETGTVADGALWYEESLPAESILAGIVQAEPNARTELSAAEAMRKLGSLLDGTLQFGGNATTGMGLATLRLRGGAA